MHHFEGENAKIFRQSTPQITFLHTGLGARPPKYFFLEPRLADWHELMIPRRIVRPSIARTIGAAVQHTDIPPPQSATLGLHPVARKLLLIIFPSREG